MTGSLEEMLIAFANWAVKEGTTIETMQDVRGSGKLEALYKRLLPEELQPLDDDPPEFAYAAIACAIKFRNHGPDKFVPLLFGADEAREMKALLLSLFLLFMIVEGDAKLFDGEEPEWFVSLAEKFRNWDRIASTMTEFPLDVLAENFQAQSEEKRKEIEKLRRDAKKFDDDVRAKIDRKQADFLAVLASQSEELDRAEKEREKLARLKEERDAENKEIEAVEEEKRAAMKEIEELEKAREKLKAAIEQMKKEELEVQRIAIDLTGMEQRDLRNRCERERERLKELEDEMKRVDGDVAEVDYSQRDDLEKEIEKLAQQVESTSPEKVRSQWNALLDAEIAALSKKVNRSQLVLNLGTYLTDYRQ